MVSFGPDPFTDHSKNLILNHPLHQCVPLAMHMSIGLSALPNSPTLVTCGGQTPDPQFTNPDLQPPETPMLANLKNQTTW